MPTLPTPPTGPCTPGQTLIVAYICNGSGEWPSNPTLTDAAELVGAGGDGAPEFRIAVPAKKCGGCDPAGLVRLGAELFKAGVEFGRGK